MGAGHVQGEFKALGIDFHRRGAILDEALDAIRGAFAAPYVSFDGDRFSYRDVGVGPAPVTGELPIWIGGMGRAAWRRAGRVGDGYIPMANPLEQYPEIIDTIRASADEAGRGGQAFDVGYMPGWAYLTGPAPDDLPPVMLVGPEALAADIRAAREAGANTMHVRFRGRTLDETSSTHSPSRSSRW